MLRKFSLVLIIVSSMAVIISQIISLTGNSALGSKVLGVALIIFGIGTVIFSANTLKNGNKKANNNGAS